MRIYIIGMPGSGKSSVAKHLAQKLNYPLIDVDATIEKEVLMFIDDLFEKYGEKKFRELETETLRNINAHDAVIACGGGIVTQKENKALMQGTKVYLDVDLDIIKERLSQDYIRPLLRKTSLEKLYEERYLKYVDFADVIISNESSIDQTVEMIINHLKKGEKA